MSLIDTRPSEHFTALVKKSTRGKSLRLLTRMHETMQNMSNALDNVRGPGSEIRRAAAAASVSRKIKCVKGGRWYLMSDGVRFLRTSFPRI